MTLWVIKINYVGGCYQHLMVVLAVEVKPWSFCVILLMMSKMRRYPHSHLNKENESRLITHTDITPPHLQHRNPNTDTHPTLPLFPQHWYSPISISHPLTPHFLLLRPESNTYTFNTLHQFLSFHEPHSCPELTTTTPPLSPTLALSLHHIHIHKHECSQDIHTTIPT